MFSIILLIILILVNAFFAASEIAVITLNDNKVRKMAEEGDKRAKRVLKLTKDSSRFLATIQVGVTLAGFLTSAVRKHLPGNWPTRYRSYPFRTISSLACPPS
ncbi:MAG: CNNM domain-containing protein [Anaeromassilibacillus sp.]